MPVGNQRNLKYLSLNVVVSSVDFPSVLQKHGKLMITSLRPSDPFVAGKPANMVKLNCASKYRISRETMGQKTADRFRLPIQAPVALRLRTLVAQVRSMPSGVRVVAPVSRALGTKYLASQLT